MPSTAKLCIWVPRRWLPELERLGRAHGTTPAGYVRILVDEAVGGNVDPATCPRCGSDHKRGMYEGCMWSKGQERHPWHEEGRTGSPATQKD